MLCSINPTPKKLEGDEYKKINKQRLQVAVEQGDKKDFEILAKQIPDQDKGRK